MIAAMPDPMEATVELTLSHDDTAVLRDILGTHLGELRGEIRRTERYEVRQELKQVERTVKVLIERLDVVLAAPA
jgi:hypothetical protein